MVPFWDSSGVLYIPTHLISRKQRIMDEGDSPPTPERSVLDKLSAHPELFDKVAKYLSFRDIGKTRQTAKRMQAFSSKEFREESRSLEEFVRNPRRSFDEILLRLQTLHDRSKRGRQYAVNTTVQTIIVDVLDQRYAEYENNSPPDRVFISDLIDVLYSVYAANPSSAPPLENETTHELEGYKITAHRHEYYEIHFRWSYTESAKQYLQVTIQHYFRIEIQVEDPLLLQQFWGQKQPLTLFDQIEAFYNLNQSIKRGKNPPDSISLGILDEDYARRLDEDYARRVIIQVLLCASGVFYDTGNAESAVYARASFVDLAV